MFDSTQREIHYLRLSVTDLCNLRCRYCMPDGVEKLEREAVLTYEEFLRLAALFAQCGIDTERVTGGEPLVRLVAMMPAMRATPSTSPFFTVPLSTAANASAFMVMMPCATASRKVTFFSLTSTITAFPAASKWVRLFSLILFSP